MSALDIVVAICLAVAGGLGVSGKVDGRASWALILAAGVVLLASWLMGVGR